MVKKLLPVVRLGLLTLIAIGASANEAQQPVGKTDVTAGFDFYYGYNGNTPPVTGAPQNSFRAFDRFHNQFILNMAEVSVKRTQGDVSFRAELMFGDMVEALHASGDNVSRYLSQGLLTYSPSSIPGFSVTAGKGYTHMGLELTRARENWQYSRSYIYWALPRWHTGLNVAYTVLPGRLTTGVYLYNQSNSLRDENSDKQLGAQIGLIPLEGLTLYYNLLTGAENSQDDRTRRTYHNLNAVWGVLPSHSVAIDSLFGSQSGDRSFNGIAFSTRHQLTDWYAFSPRVDLLTDSSGAITARADTRLTGVTLTNSFSVTQGLDLRLELRNDSSNHEIFAEGSGAQARSQFTGTVAALYAF